MPLQPDQSGMFNPNYISTTHDHFMPKNVDKDATDLYIPDWVKMDRHVTLSISFLIK